MPNPTPYIRGHGFAGGASDEAALLDGELRSAAAASVDVANAIRDIRRSDGHLANGLVTQATLAPDLIDGLAALAAAMAAEANEAADAAVDALADLPAALILAKASSDAMAAMADKIRDEGWPDYGSITEPPGPPVAGDDYGTI